MFSLENEETLKRPLTLTIHKEIEEILKRRDAELTRKEYDAKRYKLNSEKYIQRTVNYRLQLKEDIPRMKAKILEELRKGKKIWLTKKTMIKYGITHDKTTNIYS